MTLKAEDKDLLSKVILKGIEILAPLYKEDITKEILCSDNISGYLWITFEKEIQKYIKDFQETGEYTRCIDLIKSFGLEGKKFKCKEGLSTFSSHSILDSLIREAFKEAPYLKENIIPRALEKLNNSLSKTVSITASCHIVGVEFASYPVNISDNIQILPLTPLEIEYGTKKPFPKGHWYIFPEMSGVPCKIVYKEKVTLEEVVEGNSSTGATKIDDIDSVHSEFGSIIASLRLLSSNQVFLDSYVTIEVESLLFGGKSNLLTNSWSGRPNKSSPISEENTKIFLNILDKVKNNQPKCNVPISRLKASIERESPEDKVIDLVVGLESFYKSSGSAHILLRAAHYLKNTKEEKKEIYHFLNDYKNLRNQIIHGIDLSKKHKALLSKENLDNLVSILKQSLLKLLVENVKLPKESKDWVDKEYFS